MANFANNLKTGLILAGLTGLLLVVAFLIGGEAALPFALGLAVLMNVGAFFFSDRIALSAMRAKQVGPEHPLYQITQQLARQANLPMPRVYISPQPAPNAFATGRSPRHAAVCATDGLMRMLSRDEIAGVMAHELAHVKNRDMLLQTVAATIGGAISALGYMFMFGGGSRDSYNPLAGILVLLLGPLAAGLLQMALSRRREYAADTEAARIMGDPRPLADALVKVHVGNRQIPTDVNPSYNALMIAEPMNLRGGAGLGRLFSTHPPLEARLENLLGPGAAERMGV